MTSPASRDLRRVDFVNGAAKKEYMELRSVSEGVRDEADFATTNLQNKRVQETTKLKGALAGLEEVKIDQDGEAYRVFYLLKYEDRIVIMGALHKKSHKGGEIPQEYEETLKKRKTDYLKALRLN